MIEKKPFADQDGLQVIGAGLPRTGTASLQKALLILGFDPCHHFKTDVMREGFPYTNVRRWQQAFDMTEDREGRQALLRQIYFEGGHKSAVDYPTSIFVEDLVEMYPRAKFIHGVRSTPQAWRKSFNSTIAQARAPLTYFSCFLLPQQRLGLQPLIARFETLNKHLLGIGIYEPSDSVEVYLRHNERVRQVVPKDRLLEFDPKMGWEPLCEFLDVPIPTDEEGNRLEYPHVNDTEQIQKMMKIFQLVGLATWVTFIGTSFVTIKYLALPLWRRV